MRLAGDDWRALPVVAALPSLLAALREAGSVVVEAEPGAGKTTLVPLAIAADRDLGERKVLVLEPRRIAARAAAVRMAALTGAQPGGYVGYATRLDSRVSAETRVEVVTEGVLIRRLLADPAIEDIGAVVFDEFHERSLDADLALALLLDVREGLRPDLKLVVMSATIAATAVQALIPHARAIRVPGRAFPVEVVHLDRPQLHMVASAAASASRMALRETPGDVLTFLPGEAEIRRAAEQLAATGTAAKVRPLYANLPDAAQDEAIAPSRDGSRKIVLATTIAETSLTIEGVTAVVDTGLKRSPRYDARRGVTRLRTVRVSLAAAEQRKGRAGRLGPGRCYRLWPEAETRQLDAHDEPEILSADLASLALTIASWGVGDPAALAWIDPPPPGRVAEAKALLVSLGAIDARGAITAAGRRMAAIPAHPRLAHMIEAGDRLGLGAAACLLAALLSEPDVLPDAGSADLGLRLDAVKRGGRASQRIAATARRLRSAAGIAGDARHGDEGLLAAFAWPDRIARGRGGDGRFLMASGGGAKLDPADALAREPFLAIADLDYGKDALEARVRLAAPLSLEAIERHFGERIETADRVAWDARSRAVSAVRERRLGALALDRQPLAAPDPGAVAAALVEGVRREGLAALPWTGAARSLQARVAFLARLDPDGGWPDLSDARLSATLDDWLSPWLAGLWRMSDLGALDLPAALRAAMSHDQRRALDRLAPEAFEAPSGRRVPIDYADEGGPTAHVRLQEMFGLKETPRLGGGRAPLRLSLLSPAQRPVALTTDIAAFWRGGYLDARRDLRGRYPRHAWPDDPASAEPALPNRPR